MTINAALLLIDIQNDFCPGGNLAVQAGDEVVAVANRLMDQFTHVIATQDWHPANHASFAANHAGAAIGEVREIEGIQQILWPVHCVEGEKGAEFHPDLDIGKIHQVIRKGTHVTLDSYSAFFDNDHRHGTGLTEYLKSRDIHTLYVMGLATDYCVKFSVIDALNNGFKVYLIQDGCRGVELQKGDIDKAVATMLRAGATVVLSQDLL